MKTTKYQVQRMDDDWTTVVNFCAEPEHAEMMKSKLLKANPKCAYRVLKVETTETVVPER